MRFSDGFNVEKVRKAADTAQSPCRQGTVTVRASIWGIRVRLFSFLLQGISRLTLEMTSCSFGLIMIIRIKHRIRLYSLSFRGNRVTVGISRKGKRKYRRPTTIYNYSCAQPIKPSPSGESCRAATDEGNFSAVSRRGRGFCPYSQRKTRPDGTNRTVAKTYATSQKRYNVLMKLRILRARIA